VLTILLVSGITIVSTHPSKEACETLADQARARDVGSQAVQSAKCEPVSVVSVARP
jgi:hypothetical protein